MPGAKRQASRRLKHILSTLRASFFVLLACVLLFQSFTTTGIVRSATPFVEMDDDSELSDGDIVYEVQGTDSKHDALVAIVPVSMQSTPTLAAMALAITIQDWTLLGFGNDPNVAASSDLNITVERIASLFVIRLVALVSDRNQRQAEPDPSLPSYSDLSTTTICRSALVRKKSWAPPLTGALIQQVRNYVRRILEQYNGVHYHNFEHAYHVTLSCNKLIDMMLHESSLGTNDQHVKFHRKTYGFKTDPLMQMALLYSALIHDVEHTGVPNRQLVLESDDLAILYNDQSVAEQRSLAVAFSELMKDEFAHLRQVMFDSPEEYRRFRQGVINLVLTTDIASPERTQLIKSKWKEAFGETQESLERKARHEMSRRSLFGTKSTAPLTGASKGSSGSLPINHLPIKNTSMPRSIKGTPAVAARRGSRGQISVTSTGVSSVSVAFSDVTIDASLRQKAAFQESLRNIESDEDSPSVTPESTDDLEFDEDSDGVIFTGTTLSASPKADIRTQKAVRAGLTKRKNALPKATLGRSLTSPGLYSRMSLQSTQIDEDANLAMPDMKRWQSDTYAPSTEKLHGTSYDDKSSSAMTCPTGGKSQRRGMSLRRFSSPHMEVKKHSVRLGIRRSLDLTGEQIEHYTAMASSRSVTPSRSSSSGGKLTTGEDGDSDQDESDPLKMSVIMEQIIRSADIGANMQSFEHMEEWSHRLFFELKASYHEGRGEDPQNGWYDNQITFLDSYILPLARRMEDTGIFGDETGKMFADIVLENRDRWVTDGEASTSHVIQEWNILSTKKGNGQR
jgi:hypothetical protein